MSRRHPIPAALSGAVLSTALLLAGCWIAPVATVQPEGPARLIQKGIVVQSVRPVIVKSVDPDAHVIVMRAPGDTEAHAYQASLKASDFDRIETSLKGADFARILAGNKVRATIAAELTVYVSRDGQSPQVEGHQAFAANAKVLVVDPSYRLLTLQYPDGEQETLKVGREVELKRMQAGDDVMIRTLEVVALSSWQR